MTRQPGRFPPGFYAFLTGRGLFSVIDSILGTAVGWHLYQATKDPFDLALVGLFQIVPVYVFFILTGWVADHMSRKKVLQTGAVCWLGIILCIAFEMHDGNFNKWVLLSLLMALGTVKAFISPSMQAIVPNLVPPDRLGAAIAITSTVWNLALTAGPFVAGLLIALMDFKVYWTVCVICFVISICFLFLPPIGPANTGGQRSKKALWEGVHFMQRNPIVLGSLSLDLLIVLGGSIVALLPVYAADILHTGPQGLGMLRAMPAIGAVLIGIYLSKFKTDFRHAGYTLFTALFVFACSVLVFSQTTSILIACACLFIYGASDMFSVVIRGSVIQHNTPDALRGRVGALNAIFIASSNQLGDFRAGTVAAAAGPAGAALIGAITAFGVVGWGIWQFPSLRKLTSTDMKEKA